MVHLAGEQPHYWADCSGTSGQSPYICRSLAAAVPGRVQVEVAAHKIRAVEDLAWGGRGNSLVPWDRSRSSTAGTLSYGCASEGMRGRACKSHVCSPGILLVALWDARIDIRPPQSNSHTWHTTSIQACVGGCIRGETRMRPPSCIGREANAYIRSTSVLARADA